MAMAAGNQYINVRSAYQSTRALPGTLAAPALHSLDSRHGFAPAAPGIKSSACIAILSNGAILHHIGGPLIICPFSSTAKQAATLLYYVALVGCYVPLVLSLSKDVKHVHLSKQLWKYV